MARYRSDHAIQLPNGKATVSPQLFLSFASVMQIDDLLAQCYREYAEKNKKEKIEAQYRPLSQLLDILIFPNLEGAEKFIAFCYYKLLNLEKHRDTATLYQNFEYCITESDNGKYFKNLISRHVFQMQESVIVPIFEGDYSANLYYTLDATHFCSIFFDSFYAVSSESEKFISIAEGINGGNFSNKKIEWQHEIKNFKYLSTKLISQTSQLLEYAIFQYLIDTLV